MVSNFVKVNGITLHYIDWDGEGEGEGKDEGESLLFLSGFSSTAHIFGDIAPRFTDRFHVLGLTRRGHGESDKPENGYNIDTLVQDILQFLDTMHIQRVTLVGHSFAGDELTRFASLYPERVSKLIYLDAAYDYAMAPEIMAQSPPVLNPSEKEWRSLPGYKAWMKRTLGFWSDGLEADLNHKIRSVSGDTLEWAMPGYAAESLVQEATKWQRDYTKVKVPALAIYALSEKRVLEQFARTGKPGINQVRRYFRKFWTPFQRRSIEQFEQEIADGYVVEMPNTDHICFVHRQQQVVGEMRDFLLNG